MSSIFLLKKLSRVKGSIKTHHEKTDDNTSKDDLCCEPISRADWCKICAVCDESMKERRFREKIIW